MSNREPTNADVLLRAKWGTPETNRKARLYAVTSAGRRQLATEKDPWDRTSDNFHTLLHGKA